MVEHLKYAGLHKVLQVMVLLMILMIQTLHMIRLFSNFPILLYN
jgi:hypothetical protein